MGLLWRLGVPVVDGLVTTCRGPSMSTAFFRDSFCARG